MGPTEDPRAGGLGTLGKPRDPGGARERFDETEPGAQKRLKEPSSASQDFNRDFNRDLYINLNFNRVLIGILNK